MPPNLALPKDIESSDELYLIGLHLEQYRHATRDPEQYWLEAIRRDSGDCRSNNALGRWHLRRGEFQKAEQHLRIAITRLTERNPNPYDGEPHYNLGLALNYQSRVAEAYEAFYKSTWNAAWRGPAYHRLAEIDCCRQQWAQALDHINRSLKADADNLNARNLKAIVLRQLGRDGEAENASRRPVSSIPLITGADTSLLGQTPPSGQERLDLALDLMRCNLLMQAKSVLLVAAPAANDGSDDNVASMLLLASMRCLALMKRVQMPTGAPLRQSRSMSSPAAWTKYSFSKLPWHRILKMPALLITSAICSMIVDAMKMQFSFGSAP